MRITAQVAIVLTACFGTAWQPTQAAGVDAWTVVDRQARCASPAFLAKAVKERARQELKEGGRTRPELPNYSWCAVDLNNDGRLEVIYKSGLCGMGGCISQVLAWRGAKLTPIGEIGISHDTPMIGKRRHRGWRDLYILQKTTATSFSILVYTFNKGNYREVDIPLLQSELSDRRVNPDGITINRDRNEIRIGESVPEEEHEKRLQGHRGWHPSHWDEGDPGYRDEAYEEVN